MRMFPSMVHETSMVQPMWKHTAMYFQSPCTSDILLTNLMWSALFETPSDLTLSGLLTICLVQLMLCVGHCFALDLAL